MTPEQLFAQFPEADEIFKVGNSEYFFTEKEADDYCGHFNVKKEKFLRSSFFGNVDAKEEDSEELKSEKKLTKAQLKAKEEAEAKAAAEAKAKEEAEPEGVVDAIKVLESAEKDAVEASKSE